MFGEKIRARNGNFLHCGKYVRACQCTKYTKKKRMKERKEQVFNNHFSDNKYKFQIAVHNLLRPI